jgi:hypothetical protein
MSYRIRFIKNLTTQTADFLADFAAGKVPTGSNVKLLPLQWIGNNDLLVSSSVIVQLMVAIGAGCRQSWSNCRSVVVAIWAACWHGWSRVP